eukprot:TRINITY_DN1488_c0_g1_i1.p1 TRINITY_DN1488_c0_g1~~TRINITY_DN1488_c0_g1_i1.p1  ORF type:complete len:132 (-),score=5.24 TRINITY_DN1488_c0_g1_i1:1112-1507(-)
MASCPLIGYASLRRRSPTSTSEDSGATNENFSWQAALSMYPNLTRLEILADDVTPCNDDLLKIIASLATQLQVLEFHSAADSFFFTEIWPSPIISRMSRAARVHCDGSSRVLFLQHNAPVNDWGFTALARS